MPNWCENRLSVSGPKETIAKIIAATKLNVGEFDFNGIVPMPPELTITNGQLAAIVSEILTNPFSGEVDEQETFERFCTDIAKVVADYCGGEVISPASYIPETNSMDWATHYRLEVQPNESLPEGGGIWARVAVSVVEKQSASARNSFNETTQVVVFASEGVTRSVATRALPKGGVPCIVVDYDDRHSDGVDTSLDQYHLTKLGVTGEEFNKSATYIW